MKNIFVIPTNEPSRLSILNSGKLNFGAEIMSSFNSKPQHIYITSNEKIKDEDIDKFTCIFISDNVVTTLAGKGYGRVKTIGKYYKILLTDNKNLIKDGVQAIDDEFLKWFVKNPSCEEVPIITTTVNNKLLYKTNIGFESWRKEEIKDKNLLEPKQETLMEKEQLAEMLKERIFEIESSKRNKDPGIEIITVTFSADLFF